MKQEMAQRVAAVQSAPERERKFNRILLGMALVAFGILGYLVAAPEIARAVGAIK
jgi:hypothetical protein